MIIIYDSFKIINDVHIMKNAYVLPVIRCCNVASLSAALTPKIMQQTKIKYSYTVTLWDACIVCIVDCSTKLLDNSCIDKH